MKSHQIGSVEWSRLNKLVKDCNVGCGESYVIENESVFELVVWAGGAYQPLWFADEYTPSDGDIYHEKKGRALYRSDTLLKAK